LARAGPTKLDYLPLNGADLVIRKPKPKEEAEANPAQAE
jgi:hypothetical protein